MFIGILFVMIYMSNVMASCLIIFLISAKIIIWIAEVVISGFLSCVNMANLCLFDFVGIVSYFFLRHQSLPSACTLYDKHSSWSCENSGQFKVGQR